MIQAADAAPPVPGGSLRVHLFCLDALAARPGAADDLALLSPKEAALLAGIRSAARRAEVLHGRAAVRRLLARYAGCTVRDVRLQTDAQGKPQASVDGRRLGVEFNLSHAAGLIAIAVGQGGTAVGIDIEKEEPRLAPDVEGIARRHFSPDENRQLALVAPPQRLACFVRLWTMKEAVLKAIGAGLSLPLDAVDAGHGGDLASLDVRAGGQQWQVGVRYQRLGAGWHMAVACLGAIGGMRLESDEEAAARLKA